MKIANDSSSKKLAGKVALVTGGSRGIGAGIALSLAQEGADVAIGYVSSPDKASAVVATIQAQGVRAAAFKADQADAAQVQALVKNVAAHFGRLDILVNNAGVAAAGKVDDPTADLAAIDRQLAVNYTAVVVAIRTASQLMGEGGRIVTIGSVLGARATFPGIADYAATKAAVVGYSKGAARDLASRGITVNVVQSGSIATDMNPDAGDFASVQKSGIAQNRFGRPEEIGAAVTFLASPAASYVTGAVLNVDGGFSA